MPAAEPARGRCQHDATNQHTAFYLHTLAEYLVHFAGRPAVFVDIQGPDSSSAPAAFEVLRSALGIENSTTVTTVDLPGVPAASATVDLQNEHFIGLRTADALYRFFGRNAFGGQVAMTVHHFGAANAERLQREWQTWLDGALA